MNLVIVTQAQGRVPVTVFELQDRVNMGNTGQLEQAAREAFAAGGRDMLIDLSRVPSLTSAGIRTILVIHQMLAGTKDQARHLKLVNPTADVRNVLDIAGLLNYIEVYERIDEAVASF